MFIGQNGKLSLLMGKSTISMAMFNSNHLLPSGKLTKNYEKSSFLMGKSTINGHVPVRFLYGYTRPGNGRFHRHRMNTICKED
jgi:hypothetical protein